jgi:GT2 family glycosyltransferase/MoaA/NifB/PqqE/SkfB family radical SAM enzyme
MDPAMVSGVLRELGTPEIIRLNYSGESTIYPHLREAIRESVATGATVELVTALGGAPIEAIRAFVDEGLHRLSVSIHTLNDEQYGELYRYSSLDAVRERLRFLREYKETNKARWPEVDLAFVAMASNLAQLRPLAGYARSLGIAHISVHPVIRRSEQVIRFPAEIADNEALSEDFEAALRAEVRLAAEEFPGIAVARPIAGLSRLHAGISTCEQNPWDTIHILANGDVVTCEVRDREVMGNLRAQTLPEIWQGDLYETFREEYLAGKVRACRRCVWRRTIDPQGQEPAWIRGWHPLTHGDHARWAESDAVVSVSIPPGTASVMISGSLPPGAGELAMTVNNKPAVRLRQPSAHTREFACKIGIQPPRDRQRAVIGFSAAGRYRPAAFSESADTRSLGFALSGIQFGASKPRERSVRRLFTLLRALDRCGVPLDIGPPKLFEAGKGVSVVIPSRNTPKLLVRCVEAARTALAQLNEGGEIVVVLSGVESRELARLFPDVRWVIEHRPLSFLAAVRRGIAVARFPWVYLLNTDMRVEPDAIAALLPYRSARTFAIGSRIKMENTGVIETNWSDLRYREGDAAELIELDPTEAGCARGSLYAGGGSSLFQRSLLQWIAPRTAAYEPFYWEDVEWGADAWRMGYRTVFVPDSVAHHARRQTVGEFFDEREVERIFERNRLLFHLRNLPRVEALRERLLTLDSQTWAEIFSPAMLARTTAARFRTARAALGYESLAARWEIRYDGLESS